MIWNYRIVKTGKEDYGIYEVYYDEESEMPFTRAKSPFISGNSPEEVKRQLQRVISDVTKMEVLDEEKINYSLMDEEES